LVGVKQDSKPGVFVFIGLTGAGVAPELFVEALVEAFHRLTITAGGVDVKGVKQNSGNVINI
jgi:hypothetical protein